MGRGPIQKAVRLDRTIAAIAASGTTGRTSIRAITRSVIQKTLPPSRSKRDLEQHFTRGRRAPGNSRCHGERVCPGRKRLRDASVASIRRLPANQPVVIEHGLVERIVCSAEIESRMTALIDDHVAALPIEDTDFRGIEKVLRDPERSQ